MSDRREAGGKGAEAGEGEQKEFNWDTDGWEVVGAYFAHPTALVDHQINSFNWFVRKAVPDIVQQATPMWLHYKYDARMGQNLHRLELHFENPGFLDPAVQTADGCKRRVLPHDARINKYTYASELVADVRVRTTVVTPRGGDDSDPEAPPPPPRVETREQLIEGFLMGRVPVMLGSSLCATTRLRRAGAPVTGECRMDPGGYFVVNGTEKVVLTTERPPDNYEMVYANASPPAVKIKSIPSGCCQRPRACEIKAVRGALGSTVLRVFLPQVRQNIPIFTVMRALGGASDRAIHAELLLGLGPAGVRVQADQLLRASILDAAPQTEEEAVAAIACHVSSFGGSGVLTRLTGALQHAHAQVQGEQDAARARAAQERRAAIEKRKRESFTRVILRRELLPHVGEDPRKKRLFLGRLVRKLAFSLFTGAPDDDRDSFMNKRLNPTGSLMAQLFGQCYTRVMREMKSSLNKAYLKGAWRASNDFHRIVHRDNLYRFYRASLLTKALRAALSTGNLGPKGSTNLAGVSQVLNRLSHNGTASHLRRLIAPFGKSGKLVKPRKLHPTHIFAACPAETPEGAPVGFVKNLALASRVTLYCSPEPAIALLVSLGCVPLAGPGARALPLAELARGAHVLVDGDWWGTTDEPARVFAALRAARLEARLHPHTSLVWLRSRRERGTGGALGEIRVCGTGGRLVRPMYRLRPDGTFVATAAHARYLRGGGVFDALVNPRVAAGRPAHLEPALVWVDVAESNELMVAMTGAAVRKAADRRRRGCAAAVRYTHCELQPALMLGVLAGVIPFCDHNQSPRNTYQCLDQHTPVLMADGSWRPIKDVAVGDRIVTFDPVTLRSSTTRVAHQYVRETDKPMFEVTAASGETIRATHDHKFMTDQGWVEVRHLDPAQHRLAMHAPAPNGPIALAALASVTPVPTTTIADITTEADTHSFVAGAGGFCVHNSAMSKQAMGLSTTNPEDRFSTLAHQLHYPHRPMVQSRVYEYLPFMPSGQMLCVAIATNGGYNQEDSIIVNQAAVERGALVSTMCKTYRSMEQVAEGTSHHDEFCVPTEKPNVVGTKGGAYSKLSADGLARVGETVRNGDVIIGRVTPLAVKGSRCRAVSQYIDSSTVLRNSTGGIVDRARISRTEDGGSIARVVVRSTREASVGDKISSRHGQKGTIGVVRRHEDMPFTPDGRVPDIIMNPHAIPSRMTVGQIIEMFLGKVCARTGARGDATPFTGMGPRKIREFAEAVAAASGDADAALGNETMIDPVTGRPLNCSIFLAPTYYQKLKHIARDKAHGRGTGPMVEITRQPTEGRSRDGALRMGEMERDVIVAHGMSAFTRESMLRRSDDYAFGVCRRCHRMAPLNAAQGLARCDACTRRLRASATDGACGGTWNGVSRVEAPYASKLLLHELATMGIATQIHTA